MSVGQMTPDASGGQPSTGKRTRPWWLWMLLALAIIGLLVGILGNWLLYVWQTGKREVARAIAETNALDPHWRWEDLLAQREQVIPAENAWSIVWNIAHRLQNHPRSRQLFNDAGFSVQVTDELKREPNRRLPLHLVELLEQFRADDPLIGQLAFQLLACRRAQVPAPPLATDPWATLLPDHQESRGAMNALRFLHEWCLSQRRYEEAEALLMAHWIVVSSFDDDYFLIGQLIGTALEGLAVARLERHLALTELAQPTIQRLKELLERRAMINRFLMSVKGERAIFQATYENLMSGKLSWRDFVQMGWLISGSTHTSNEWWVRIGQFFKDDLPEETRQFFAYYYSHHFHAFTLQYHNELMKLALLPVAEQGAAHNRASLQLPQAVLDTGWAGAFVRRYAAMGRIWNACGRSRARLQAARAALAAEEYRLRYGRLPTTWKELVPEFLTQAPLDPFDGNPMRLNALPEGIVIYSIGWDGTDNGGSVGEDRDAGFRVYYPLYRNLPP